MSRQRDLELKLAILDSRLAKNLLIYEHYKRRRNQHAARCQMLHLQQFHLALMLESSRAWSYSKETTYWEVFVQEMTDESFKDTFRMHRKTFDKICLMLDSMKKSDCGIRKCIPLEKRIAIALYVLKSSDNYLTIGKLFGVGKSTVCEITHSFCEKLWETMSSTYIPSNFITNENIQQCMAGFKKMGLPQCFGAIDGCHIDIHPATNQSSEYMNKRGENSMILLALVDHNRRFMYINVGSPGGWNNSAIFEKSRLPQILSSESLQKHSKCINGTSVPVFIIGDSTFTLTEHLMKPFPFSIGASDPEIKFNRRILKCHKVVGETFQHLRSRFGRVGKGIGNSPRNASKVIQACCLLHNFLMAENDKIKKEWIETQLTFENKFLKQQPEEFEVVNFNSRGEEIRNCLANYIFNLSNDKTF